MSTTMLLLLSGVLIGAGVSLIWRDVHKRQRGDVRRCSAIRKAGSEAEPEVEITVSRRAEPALKRRRGAPAARKPRNVGAGRHDADAPRRAAAPDRPPSLAQQWAALQPAIGAAVEQVNAVLAGAGVAIGSPGEPSWSIEQGLRRAIGAF